MSAKPRKTKHVETRRKSKGKRCVTPAEIRKMALCLPDSIEKDHHGIPSFRVNERIFATQWDEDHLNVMLPPPRIMDAVQEHPGTCEELWWGQQLRCVRVNLQLANAKLVRWLLKEAWERKRSI